MTDIEMFALLKERAKAAQLRGKVVDELLEKDAGAPGLFVPPGRRPHSTIFLKPGRPVQKMVFTLCHELGHFWSYASGRRTALYNQVLRRQQEWEDWISLKIRNNEAILQYPKVSDAP